MLNIKYLKTSSSGTYGLPLITDGNGGIIIGTNVIETLSMSGYSWASGLNSSYELGDGTDSNSLIFFKTSSTLYDNVECGRTHTFLLSEDKTVFAIGDNTYGQLGTGDTTNLTTLTQINGLSNIKQISAGGSFTLFLKEDGTVYSCGDNGGGQLGDGSTTDNYIPTVISGLTDVSKVIAGYNFSLFLKSDGTVYCCGYNSQGQLGTGDTANVTTLTQMSGVSDITDIAACKYYSSHCLKSDGTVYSCGQNNWGQLGLGTTTTPYTTMTLNENITGVESIYATANSTFYLKSDGTLYGTGHNLNGQLGIGSNTNAISPTAISINNVKSVSGFMNTTCFLTSNETVYLSGRNDQGQLGTGDQIDVNSPILSSLTSVKQVSSGNGHTIILSSLVS